MGNARVAKKTKHECISLLDNGKYFIEVRPWGARLPDGRLAPKKRATRDTLTEAFKVRAEFWALGEAEPKQKKADDKRLLSELVEEWYSLHGQSLDSGEGQQGKMLKVINGYLGNMQARKLTAGIFGEARKKLLKDGLSPAAVNRHHAYLRAMFNVLKKFGKWEGDNPVAGIPVLAEVEKELTYLDADERKRLLNACDHSRSPHIKLMIMLALATGGRWSEIYNLKKSHLKGNKLQFVDTKGGKRRFVAIADELAEALRSHRPHSNYELFPKARSAFEEVVKRANIKLPKGQLTHVLRHTHAVNHVERGGSLHTLQRILGHEEITTTMIYVAFAPDNLEQMLELNPLVTDGVNISESLQRGESARDMPS